jgi:hypothetical protein
MLPFEAKKPVGGEMLTVVYTRRAGASTHMCIGDVRVPSVIGRFSTDPSDTGNLAGSIGQR